jgi:hypothetical protein
MKPASGAKAQPIPQVPRLGQPPADGHDGPLADFEPPITALKVESRCVRCAWLHVGHWTLAESAGLATRFSNSAPQSSQRYS